MPRDVSADLRDVVSEHGIANCAEELGRQCEGQARRAHGGVPDSLVARQRKAWQKAAKALAQVAVDLRLEC